MEKTPCRIAFITARNPKTEGTLLCPVVTNRSTMSMKQLVAYGKTAGYVHGQQKDLKGLLRGFIEAMQDCAKAGYVINVNDWFIIGGQLRDTVGEDRQLTSANSYHVTISASKDLKSHIDEFSWSRVDDTGVIIKVENISSPNGAKCEIIKTKAIVATGKNLVFDASFGDTVTVTWTQDGAENPPRSRRVSRARRICASTGPRHWPTYRWAPSSPFQFVFMERLEEPNSPAL